MVGDHAGPNESRKYYLRRDVVWYRHLYLVGEMSMLRWSEEQLAAHQRMRASLKPVQRAPATTIPNAPPKSLQALGRLKTGELNKLEAKYAGYLGGLKESGEVLWFKFEGVKLRLADNTFYTPDFAVLRSGGQFELHEVKGGRYMDDARVKIKVAAALYPFRFIGVMPRAKNNGGGWKVEEF